MADNTDTIAAIATPPGRGGIGIIRLSGPAAGAVAAAVTGISTPNPGKVYYAAFTDEQDRIIDRGLLLYFQKPASYTGEDVIELHGHGGPVVMGMLLNRVLGLGARLARPGEFTERAYLNDKLDLLQAEAVADLISSCSEKAARSAIHSLEGGFSESINRLVRELIAIRTYVEGALDFPEEEIDFLAENGTAARVQNWLQGLEDLLAKAEQGRLLSEGLRVVILGRPNVGKSSLLNQLTQTNRAIVTDIPGTTRDVIEEDILIEGIPLNLADTAGLRNVTDQVEEEGIKRARQAAGNADIVLLVVDAGGSIEEQVTELQAEPGVSAKKLVVVNKIDLCPNAKTGNTQDTVYVSAKTGAGMETLRQELKRLAGLEDESETVLLARTRHINALLQAQQFVTQGIAGYKEHGAAELLAEELSRAQRALATITGEFSADDLLGEIFSSFCIGK